MPERTPNPSISEEAAMLIERALRDDLSPEQRARLGELVEQDPQIEQQLADAEQEQHAMNTTAELFNRHADTDRMQQAIRQKLDLDRRMVRRFLIAFGIWLPIYFALFVYGSGPVNWQLLIAIIVVPMLPLIVWGILTVHRRRRFRRALDSGDSSIADEYTHHLHRSRNEHTIARAGWFFMCIGLPLMITHDFSTGNNARAILLLFCFVVMLYAGWKTVLNRSVQQRTDLFFQGRLTLEDLFDRRQETSNHHEQDGE